MRLLSLLITAPLLMASGAAIAGRYAARRAPEGSTRPTRALTHEPGLQSPVDLEEPYITLGEALARITAKTKVKLRATPDLQGDNVSLFIRSRPAGAFLDLLADTLGYRWSKVEGDRAGYLLWQEAAARKQELELRQRLRV